MKEGFRQCMAWLHTWAGLVVGWVLFFVFVTGTAGYFAYEIDRWMRPELPTPRPIVLTPAEAVARAQLHLEKVAAGAQEWSINLPGSRTSSQLSVSWRQPPAEGQRAGRFTRKVLDEQGEPAAEPTVRKTGGGYLLYRMHYELRYLPNDLAIRLVGACTMLMFLALISGVVTHKKIFADFFTFRPGKGQRSWLDAHNLVSVAALPFFLMITYSGLVFFLFQYMPAGLQAGFGSDRDAYFAQIAPRPGADGPSGQPAPVVPLASLIERAEQAWGAGEVGRLSVAQPADAASVVTVHRRTGRQIAGAERLSFSGATGEPVPLPAAAGGTSRKTQDVLLALHEGHFAGWWMRWAYFVSGLLGCAMIATGLVLWTAKRKVKQDKRRAAGQSPEFGYRLVEALNIGTIAGLCTAVAVYFWANRLLPVDFEARREWEVHCLFITWGLLLVHAAWRLATQPSVRVWTEQFVLTAAAFALLPVLNALTTQRHLGVSLPAGDWVMAGFDLTVLALGACFALLAWRLRRKLRGAPAVAHRPSSSMTAKAPL